MDATVDEVSGAGKVHVFKLEAIVETGEPVEEEATETEKPETEPSGGIPVSSILSIGVALLLVSLILYMKQRQ